MQARQGKALRECDALPHTALVVTGQQRGLLLLLRLMLASFHFSSLALLSAPLSSLLRDVEFDFETEHCMPGWCCYYCSAAR